MPARNFPIIVIQLKFNQKLCHLSRQAPPDAFLSLSSVMPCQKSKTTKAKAKSWKSEQLSASVRAHNQRQHKHTHKHTPTHTHTHVAQLAVRCSQGLHCNKNHRTTGKNGGETDTKKKIIFTFTMTMSLCCRPATPSLSMPATLMVCEINRQRERERGRCR